MAEREEISRGVVAGRSIRSIAARLGRAPSTVSREINRNGGHRCYRATIADQAAWDRAHRPKTCKLAENRALARIVAGKLRSRWSPRQIAGWLKRTYPDDEHYQVSHETIYRSLFIQARGALKKELLGHLRRTRAMRRSRHHPQSVLANVLQRPVESAVDNGYSGNLEIALFWTQSNVRFRPNSGHYRLLKPRFLPNESNLPKDSILTKLFLLDIVCVTEVFALIQPDSDFFCYSESQTTPDGA